MCIRDRAGTFAQTAVGRVAEDRVLVAVGLAGNGAVDARGLPVGGQLFQCLREGPYGVGQLGGAGVVREEFGEVRAQGGGAARFEDDQGVAVPQQRAQDLDRAAHHRAGPVELTGGDIGQAAAQGAVAARQRRGPGRAQGRGRRQEGAQSGGFQDRDGGPPDLRGEVIGEGVGPEDDRAAGRGFGGCFGRCPVSRRLPAAPPPAGEGLGGQFGDRALGRDPAEAFADGGQRRTGEDVEGGYGGGRGVQPLGEAAHRVVRGGAPPARVVVVQELRLVGGHVDPYGAVAATALAGQTEVEGVTYLRRLPAVRDHLTGQHLVQQTGPAAGGVLLLTGGAEGRAHDVRRARTGRGITALGDADTAPYGRGEVAVVVRVAELDRDRALGQHLEAEVLVEPGGADEHAGVEPRGRVPERLEAFEEADELGAVHLREQFGAGLAVAVLAGERSAVRHHQFAQVVGELPEAADAGRGQQVEVDTDVDAAVAEVPVGRAAQTVLGQQGAEVPQIRAEPGGWYGAVLPAWPGLGAVGQPGGGAGGVLADPPQGALVGRVGDEGVVGGAVRGRRPAERLGPRRRFTAARAAHLHEQPGAALGQSGRVAHQVGGHPLDGHRAVGQQRVGGLGRRALVGVAEDGEGPRRRSLHQPYGRLGQYAEGALAAGEGTGEVGARFRQQRVQRVAGDPAGEVGVAGAQQRQLPVDQGLDAVPQPRGQSGRGAGGVRTAAGPHLLAAVRQQLQLADAVGGGAPDHRVRAAGVVADHAAEGAAAVGGRVGAEGQSMRSGRRPQVVQDDAGLDDGGAGGGVQRHDAPHVPGEVQHHADAGRLPGDTGPAAARHHRHAVLPAHPQRRRDVLGVLGRDHRSGHPPVIGRVHRHQCPVGRGERDLPPYRGRQLLRQVPLLRLRAISHVSSLPTGAGSWGIGRPVSCGGRRSRAGTVATAAGARFRRGRW